MLVLDAALLRLAVMPRPPAPARAASAPPTADRRARRDMTCVQPGRHFSQRQRAGRAQSATTGARSATRHAAFAFATLPCAMPARDLEGVRAVSVAPLVADVRLLGV